MQKIKNNFENKLYLNPKNYLCKASTKNSLLKTNSYERPANPSPR